MNLIEQFRSHRQPIRDVKVGAVNGAWTNCPFTNWRSKMHDKTQLG